MPDPRSMLAECDAALLEAALTPRDEAAAALCRRYARLIDHAASLASEAEVVWELLDIEDMTGRRQLAKLVIAFEAQRVASDLGPKLLAGLTALGCTPAGRQGQGKEAPRAVDPAVAAADELLARRASRAARANGATALDATT